MAADRADNTEQELLKLTKQLLDSIGAADWAAYEKLCDPTITCFEPEARGHVVEGLPFHKFYFDLPAPQVKPAVATQVTMASPHVRLMGDAAVVSYARLNQKLGPSGDPVTVVIEETRVWQKLNGAWKHVHFHRSPPG